MLAPWDEALLMFVHPMKGDGNGALHFRPGDLRQILGVEDEEVSWSLGAGSHHNGQQHPWRHSTALLCIYHSRCRIKYICCWHTVILIYPIRSLNKEGLWGVRVWFLPYPGLLGLHIQLADLHASKKQNQVTKKLLLNTLHLQLKVFCQLTLSGMKWLRPRP